MIIYDANGNPIELEAETSPIQYEDLYNVQYTNTTSGAQMCLVYDLSQIDNIQTESLDFDYLVNDEGVTKFKVAFRENDTYSTTSVGTGISMGPDVNITKGVRGSYHEDFGTLSTKNFVIFWITFTVSSPAYPINIKLFDFTFKVNGQVIPMYNWYIMEAYGSGYLAETKVYKENENLVKQNAIVHYADENHWAGKKWIALGTSITANVPSYVPYLAEISGLSCTKAGNGGGQISRNGTIYNNIMNRDFSNFDLITLEGFVNDWYGNAPMGEIGDTTTDTFLGSLYNALVHIKESNPNATLVLITDHHTRKTSSFPNFDIFSKNTEGLTQQDYRDATTELCNFLGIPVIHAGEKCGMSYLTPDYYLDQIHHTVKGSKAFANTIWADLKEIPIFGE